MATSSRMEIFLHGTKGFEARPGRNGDVAWVDLIVTGADGVAMTITMYLDGTHRTKGDDFAEAVNTAADGLRR